MVHSIISHLWKRAKMEKKKSLSEQYRASANDIHEDLCESDSDCEQELDSESEEENILESAIIEEENESVITKKNEHYEFLFGSFGHSDLDTISSVPVISVKPTIDATTIKIGDITCIIKGSKSSTVELSQATRTLTDEVAKEEIIVDLVSEDNEHIDFGTVVVDRTSSSVNFSRKLDSVLLWFAPPNHDSVSTTTSVKFSIPLLFISEPSIGVDALIVALKRKHATTVFATGSRSFNHDACIRVFDPGGLCVRRHFAVAFGFLDERCRDGNHRDRFLLDLYGELHGEYSNGGIDVHVKRHRFAQHFKVRVQHLQRREAMLIGFGQQTKAMVILLGPQR